MPFYDKNPDIVLIDTKDIAHAHEAAAATKANVVVTPALETVMDANTLLSGIGFESSGLAAVHAIYNGFR